MSLYLSRIEGPPPKRNAGGSTPPKDDKKTLPSVVFLIISKSLWIMIFKYAIRIFS